MKFKIFKQIDKFQKIAFAFLGAFTILTSNNALAHARWYEVTLPNGQVFKARNQSDALKTGPCGGVPVSANPTFFTPGQAVTLKAVEVIIHPGGFEVSISRDAGVTFTPLATVANKGAGTTPRYYDIPLTIPTQTCETGCILRLIQHMTDRVPPSDYYSCADIKITTSAPPVVTPAPPLPTPAATPTVVPTPSPAATQAASGSSKSPTAAPAPSAETDCTPEPSQK